MDELSYELIGDIMKSGKNIFIVLIHSNDSLLSNEANNLATMLENLEEEIDTQRAHRQIILKNLNLECGLTMEAVRC